MVKTGYVFLRKHLKFWLVGLYSIKLTENVTTTILIRHNLPNEWSLESFVSKCPQSKKVFRYHVVWSKSIWPTDRHLIDRFSWQTFAGTTFDWHKYDPATWFTEIGQLVEKMSNKCLSINGCSAKWSGIVISSFKFVVTR